MSTSALRLDVVLPIFNEAGTLAASVRALHATMEELMDFPHWQITIADNASTDESAAIAIQLADDLPRIRLVLLPEKGRGGALKEAWLTSKADVVAYMDIDLSTDLRALPPLVAPLLSGHSDIAIGSRLAHGSRVVRGAKREALSRGYNMLLHGVLGVSFSDAQCGFKAMTSRSARALLPLVKDNAWFFDTEFLVLAERAGLRIAEVPIDWMDDPVSSVNIGSTVRQDLRGVTRLSWNLARNRIPLSDVTEQLGRKPLVQGTSLPFQLVHFAIVGVASTIVFSLLYYLLQFVLTPQSANFIALAISAVFNTMVNRHVTFGVRDRSSAERHLLQGLLVFATTWLLTSGALALVHTSAGNVDPRRDLIVLTIANIFATVLRFVAFRFMFHPEPPHTTNRECRLTRLELLSA